ncbi:major facilitator superfamily domain-containing protein [Hypoxylon fragiforme]|uniref:major facilitator superfamily domain-containing protein n=1 Tax=Hypoxylon fragiforme TaxID=63214 RepID=UPI0020C7363C|nr:major facilitator superfamily domain-containing protein [Hypoxylon fragiforme]KAI2608195.1 major facilitator superfamily domain-containing protein [Hypoxylon fragiforme]
MSNRPRLKRHVSASTPLPSSSKGGITLGFGSLLYGGYYIVLTTLPIQLAQRFGLNSAQTGLCYLSIFLGAVLSRFTAGRLLDWNFRRHATRLGIAGIEVTLFFLGLFNEGRLSGLSVLVVYTHQESPATALAANNLFRCLVSTGRTAVAVALIDRIGIGWTAVFIAGTWLCCSPLLWLVLLRGAGWRREKKVRMDEVMGREEAEKENEGGEKV